MIGTAESWASFQQGEVYAIRQQIYGDLKAELTAQIVASQSVTDQKMQAGLRAIQVQIAALHVQPAGGIFSRLDPSRFGPKGHSDGITVFLIFFSFSVFQEALEEE